MGSNVAHAQHVFATNHNPAPYYVYLLLRAQRATAAVQVGCAGPATAGGTVAVQRHTAQHKQCRKAPANHARTPTATRAQWVTVTVPVVRTQANGQRVRKLCRVTNRKQVTVVA